MLLYAHFLCIAVADLLLCHSLKEMHNFPHTLSTRNVNSACSNMNSCDNNRKKDPGNRDIYRRYVKAPDLVQFQVVVKETDLLLLAEYDLRDQVLDLVLTHRYQLENWILKDPAFRESLLPIDVPDTAPAIVRMMAAAGRIAGVGPMAAVAGAVSEVVAAGLGDLTTELIIENGGDLLLASRRERIVGIFTGEDGNDLFLGLKVTPGMMPVGIATSSGRIGHSLSFGESTAATVLAPSAALADAAATAVGNRVRGRDGIRDGLLAAQVIPGIIGAVVVRDGELGAWGRIELVNLAEGRE